MMGVIREVVEGRGVSMETSRSTDTRLSRGDRDIIVLCFHSVGTAADVDSLFVLDRRRALIHRDSPSRNRLSLEST